MSLHNKKYRVMSPTMVVALFSWGVYKVRESFGVVKSESIYFGSEITQFLRQVLQNMKQVWEPIQEYRRKKRKRHLLASIPYAYRWVYLVSCIVPSLGRWLNPRSRRWAKNIKRNPLGLLIGLFGILIVLVETFKK